jgi:hypothetical protein
MTKIALMVLVLAASGGGKGNRNAGNAADWDAEPVGCTKAPADGMPLFFKVRQPADVHGPAAREILREQFPCMKFECTRKGDMLATIGKTDAKKLLGGHVVYSTVKGAGNSAGKDALFVQVRPVSFVPEILKEHVERLTFHDDPKLEYTGPATRKCE